MLRSGRKNSLLLLLVVLCSVNQIYQCSSSKDPFYEVNKQEFSNEINDLNEYMQMVADQLSNDGVIVVRATRTRFTNSDLGNESLKSKTKDLTREDSIAAIPKTVGPVKLDDELSCRDGNVSLIGEHTFYVKESDIPMEETPFEIENFEQYNNANHEILC